VPKLGTEEIKSPERYRLILKSQLQNIFSP